MSLESFLEGLDHQRPGASSASRDCRTLKTIKDHAGPCQESPFAIARAPDVNGGKTGGTIRFLRVITTVLEPSQNVFWRSGQSLSNLSETALLSSAKRFKNSNTSPGSSHAIGRQTVDQQRQRRQRATHDPHISKAELAAHPAPHQGPATNTDVVDP